MEVNGSWLNTLVPQPDGSARIRLECFVVGHGPKNANHQVLATATVEFPNPEIGKILLETIAQAVARQAKALVIPATVIPQDRN